MYNHMRPYSCVNECYPDLFNSSLTPQINKYFNDDRLTNFECTNNQLVIPARHRMFYMIGESINTCQPVAFKIQNDVDFQESFTQFQNKMDYCINPYYQNIDTNLKLNFCICNLSVQNDYLSPQSQGYQCEDNRYNFIEQKYVGPGLNTNETKKSSMMHEAQDFMDSYESYIDKESNPLIKHTVEEVLQSQVLSNAVQQGPNYGRSRRRLYHLRQDVIIKIIFRSMRKHYMKDFKAFFDFSKCNSYNHVYRNNELIDKVNKYLTIKFGGSTMENFAVYFISIIDIKEKFASFNSLHKKLKECISELLYCYSKPKLFNLIKIPQFALLLLIFLSKRDILNCVIKSKHDAEAIHIYSEIIQNIKCQCNISLRM